MCRKIPLSLGSGQVAICSRGYVTRLCGVLHRRWRTLIKSRRVKATDVVYLNLSSFVREFAERTSPSFAVIAAGLHTRQLFPRGHARVSLLCSPLVRFCDRFCVLTRRDVGCAGICRESIHGRLYSFASFAASSSGRPTSSGRALNSTSINFTRRVCIRLAHLREWQRRHRGDARRQDKSALSLSRNTSRYKSIRLYARARGDAARDDMPASSFNPFFPSARSLWVLQLRFALAKLSPWVVRGNSQPKEVGRKRWKGAFTSLWPIKRRGDLNNRTTAPAARARALGSLSATSCSCFTRGTTLFPSDSVPFSPISPSIFLSCTRFPSQSVCLFRAAWFLSPSSSLAICLAFVRSLGRSLLPQYWRKREKCKVPRLSGAAAASLQIFSFREMVREIIGSNDRSLVVAQKFSFLW